MKNLAFLVTLMMLSGNVFALQGQCIDHYTKEGSFFKGKTFRTWAEYPTVSTDVAFEKVTHAILKQGFSITSSDKATGSISSQHGTMGSSATLPLNAAIEAKGQGSRVELTFSAVGGVMMLSEDKVKSGFCDITEAVSQ